MSASDRRGWWMKMKIGSAGLGVVMGVLVFVIFTFVYGNHSAGIWALLSGLLSALVLHQHVLFSKGTLASFYNPRRFTVLLISGTVLLIVSLSVTIYFFTMKIKLNQETYPIEDR